MTLFGTTRHAGYGFETQREDSWRDEAACVGEDPNIFHRLSPGDPGTKGMNQHQIKKLEIKNFAKAKTICDTCPVRPECQAEGDSARYGDTSMNPGSMYSVYGGNYPHGWVPAGAGRPKADTTVPLDKRACIKGHVGQWRRDGSGYRCRTCDTSRKREAYQRPPGVVMTPEERHATDPKYDHEYEPGFMSGKRVCKECRRRIYRRWKAEQRALKGEAPVAPGERINWDERHMSTKGHSPEWHVKPNGRRYCKVCARDRDRSRRRA